MALLIGKCRHAVHVGNIVIRSRRLERHAQHFRRVAAVEFKILMRFDDDEIARKFIRYLLAQLQSPRQIVIDPGPQHRGVELLAPRGKRRGTLGCGQISRGEPHPLRCFEQHP